MKERNTTLDLAKGILIILVVLGHAIQYSGNGNWEDSQLFFDDIVFRAIYSFHMPLFYFASGLFFKTNLKITTYLKKLTKQIILPYIIFSIIFSNK